jgi:hypothetical protein
LKYAEFVPLFKKGEKIDTSNYRPVSLLTAFSKVFEKVVCVRLYQHLINHSVLLNEQFGFKAKSSAAKATCNLISEILEALNSKKVVGDIFCDLEKAFFLCQLWYIIM